MPIFDLSDELIFPHPTLAGYEGLLAIGGDLQPERLLLAYANGIFPWFSKGDPIYWWSPDPRCVLYPQQLKVSKSMRSILNQKKFTITYDQNFVQVIENCAKMKREGQRGTWITKEMKEAYIQLHEMGFAHSVEVWLEKKLAGGLYGISLGSCFFGESMFSKVSNTSKAGFIALVKKLHKKGFTLIDCQVHTPHMESLGAVMLPREQFLEQLGEGLEKPTLKGDWSEFLSD